MAGKISRKLKHLEKALSPQKLAQEAYKVFRANTPIKSGNARRNTHLTGDTVQGDYPYATRLDNGWSRQSPDGMTIPTLEFIKDYIKKESKKG
jgi:hypothetical protein